MPRTDPQQSIIEILHKRRFQRFLNLTSDVPRLKGICAWCGKPKRNEGRKYCGSPCSKEAIIRAGFNLLRTIFKRDRGICVICGIDANSIKLELNRIKHSVCLRWVSSEFKIWKKQWGPWWTNNYQYWEVDHTTPVSKGGGCCGAENLRTLCLECHKKETKKLAQREI